jgi:hypothetical protein
MKHSTQQNDYLIAIFSDLRDSWSYLHNAISSLPSSDIHDRWLFHIEKAMCLEGVRDLSAMREAFLLIRHMIQTEEAITNEVAEWIDDIEDLLSNILEMIQLGYRV